MAKTILITGDVGTIENVLQTEAQPTVGFGDRIEIQPWRGGAWLLADMVRQTCGPDLKIYEPDGDPVSISYARWNLSPRKTGQEKEERVWRIKEFLGTTFKCDPNKVQSNPDASPKLDLILIEDVGLYFRNQPAAWPSALAHGWAGIPVILNLYEPISNSKLWLHLLEHFADSLTVVLPVSALKARNARISAPISWDQAIVETVREFRVGVSAIDLARARTVVVNFGTGGAAIFTRQPEEWKPQTSLLPTVRLDRFLYDPDHNVRDMQNRYPGQIWNGPILAAAVTRHQLEPDGCTMFLAVGRGLAAVRDAHEAGGGPPEKFGPETSLDAIAKTFQTNEKEPADTYYTAFPHSTLSDPEMKTQPEDKSNLLQDLTGTSVESVLTKGFEIVFYGRKPALQPAPKAEFGKYFTVDREEIERINAVRNLIDTYLNTASDDRPLSIAVFGPPGSGKSFAVKQLVESVAKKQAQVFDFNLSQFQVADLHLALQMIRNGAAKGKIPFVFWDEFDTSKLIWLREFLAPMQDGQFQSGGATFFLGKAVFIFAGGTVSTMAAFSEKAIADPEVKGPDFVSRLRGFINVKGPNPSPAAQNVDKLGLRGDLACIIRRAIMLRGAIEMHAPHLISSSAKRAAISPRLVRAFLFAEKYLHGARSLQSLVTMSDLHHARSFRPSQLPSRDLILMHVSPDFLEYCSGIELEPGDVDLLAAACHAEYCKRRLAGGADPNDKMMQPFDKLSDHFKESNRGSVRMMLAHLADESFHLSRTPLAKPPSLADSEKQALMMKEHDRWMREKLQRGWYWARKTNRDLRMNEDIKPYEELPDHEKRYDELPVEVIIKTLAGMGYQLQKCPCHP